METSKVEVICPSCKSPNDGHTEVGGSPATPSDGDLSVCVYCGAVTKYRITDTTSQLVELNSDEYKEAMEHPGIRRAVALVRAINANG